MGRSAAVTLVWGDGEHTFKLLIGELSELEEKCDCGARFIRNSIATETERVKWVRETIRIGLVGGGMKAAEAHKLVTRYVDEVPQGENRTVAFVILGAALEGVPDEPLGKSQGEAEAESTRSPGKKSGSKKSMESA